MSEVCRIGRNAPCARRATCPPDPRAGPSYPLVICAALAALVVDPKPAPAAVIQGQAARTASAASVQARAGPTESPPALAATTSSPALTALTIQIPAHPERPLQPNVGESISLRHFESSVAFRFGGAGQASEASRSQYRLTGVDGAWVDGGREWRVRYAGLQPGRYVFEVRQAAGDAWSAPISVPLDVRGPYWRTWWFQGMGIALLALLLWVARARGARRTVQMERVRFQIASRLHDDIGASLSSIAMRTDMLSQRTDLERGVRERLGHISATARRTAGRLREMVWVFNAEHDTVQALAARIEESADELLEGICTYELNASGALATPIDMELRHDVHLLAKEALSNAARHAEAKHLRVDVDCVGGRELKLRIADDGRGFAPAAVSRGNGLGLMTRHAQRHHGALHVESEPGVGTRVALSVPLG